MLIISTRLSTRRKIGRPILKPYGSGLRGEMLNGSLAKAAPYVRNALHYKAAVRNTLPTEIKTKISMNINGNLSQYFPTGLESPSEVYAG